MTFLCTREPGELFLCGGNLPKAKPPVLPGPYVAKVDPATGKQIWRTYVENANVTGNWIGVNNLNILANGTIVTAWSNQTALLDPGTGRILRTGTLPSGEAPPADSHFKHLTVAPDGTLILKNQTRAAGITDQGTMAMVKGVRKGMKMPPSIFVAVDGETLEVLDTAQLPELAATPHGITTFDGRIAIYTCADRARLPVLLGPGLEEAVARRIVGRAVPGRGTVDRRRAGDHGRLDHDPDQRHRREGALERGRDQPARSVAGRRRSSRSGR